jgi:predicted transcriptional regulator
VRPLGELERAVMEHVWRLGRPVTGREVVNALGRERSLAYTTVLTIMDRLVKKGILTKARVGRAFAYQPLQSREAYTAGLMAEVLDDADDPQGVLLHFVDRISAKDVRLLRDALQADPGRHSER